MELYQLRTFVAVAREGNLTRAAEKLFTSLPAVSAQVKALEEEFGVQLFRRTPRGMELTPAGDRLLEEAGRTLAAAERVREAAAQARGEVSGVVRMGTVSDPLMLRLGDVLVRLAERHPGIAMRLSQGISGQVLDGVRRGEIDCGYLLSAERPDDLALERLAPVAFVAALPPRHAAEAASLTLESVTAMPWVAMPPRCATRPLLEALFREAGRAPRLDRQADSEASVRSLVASGMGAGLMREDLARAAEDAGEVVVWPHWRAPSWLCWVSRPAPAGAVAAVRDAVRDAWGMPSP